MTGKRAERLQVMLTLEEVRMVEEWRYEHRMPSRSAAVRALMNLGLQTKSAVIDESALLEGHVSSRDVGVVENGTFVSKPADGDENRPTILVMETDFLVGRGIRSVLEEEGFSVLGPVASVEEARSALKSNEIDAAVLDPRANGDGAAEIADVMAKRDVPFIFCTTEDPKQILPEHLWSAPVVSLLSARKHLAKAVGTLIEKVPS